MPAYVQPDFSPNAVQPIECLKEGWSVIKDQYWLFVGMTLVATLLGQMAPMGILMPPLRCGVYLAIFARMRGQPVEFGNVFKGFDYFGQSVIALFLHLIPVVIALLPFVMLILLGTVLMRPEIRGGPTQFGAGGFLIFILVSVLLIVLVLLALSVVFTFAFPLIVDRKLSGVDAVKLSFKAGLANYWRLLGLLLLNGLLGLVGVMFCYVGALLVMPLSFAATACAYRQVFGLTPIQTLYPPPPPMGFK
jgi:uncharacterized membrane protein